MTRQNVLLLGAHGETGGDILEGLLEDGNFNVSALVQPSSASKPAVLALAARGIPLVIGSLSSSVDDLATLLTPFDTLISAIHASSILAQLPLVDAAAKAGIKRFVPCDFASVVPPGGIMALRDDKEVVHQRIWRNHLPYTIVDVGYWHQISFPRVPSGRFDHALIFESPEIYGDGEGKTLLGDKRDIGRWVARIIRDGRTLNRKVVAWSDEVCQNEIVGVVEGKTGERVEMKRVSKEQLESAIARADEKIKSGPGDLRTWLSRSNAQYSLSKFIRQDGTLGNAKYLGYLDARELYPDFKPISFEEYVDELLAGGGKMPWETTNFKVLHELRGEGEERFTLRTEA